MTGRLLRLLVGALLLSGVLVAPGVAVAEPVLCQGEVATIVGTADADTLTGTEGDDVIAGLGGDDRIYGLGGSDLICAGAGNDEVRGDAGDDRIFGEAGNDFLFGGPGADTLAGGGGDDVLQGGFGSDQVLGGSGNDELWGSSCTPMSGMGHFCRIPPSAEGDETEQFAALFAGTRVLEAETSGVDVTALQLLLTRLGFDAGPADGAFGPATESAVRAFQLSRGPEADGVVGAETRAALAEALEAARLAETAEAATGGPDDSVGDLGARLLRPGLGGADVAALQGLLAELGFNPGPVDGVFGASTEAALRAFQAANDLEADGVAGPQTKAELLGESGAGDSLAGGAGFDTCNSPDTGTGCESERGLRTGAPWDAAAAEEWRPLITEAFRARGLEGEIEHALAIVACESLADPFITTPSTPAGSHVVGLFQHKDAYWVSRAAAAGVPGASPLDPAANAQVAAWMVARSIQEHSDDPTVERPGWVHWVCDEALVERGLWE